LAALRKRKPLRLLLRLLLLLLPPLRLLLLPLLLPLRLLLLLLPPLRLPSLPLLRLLLLPQRKSKLLNKEVSFKETEATLSLFFVPAQKSPGSEL
jgi:hypothetical protein